MFGGRTPKKAGEVEYRGVDGTTVVREIKQCCHCGVHWVVRPGSGIQRGFCRNCMGDVCGAEVCVNHCHTFEAKIEEIERTARKLIT